VGVERAGVATATAEVARAMGEEATAGVGADSESVEVGLVREEVVREAAREEAARATAAEETAVEETVEEGWETAAEETVEERDLAAEVRAAVWEGVVRDSVAEVTGAARRRVEGRAGAVARRPRIVLGRVG
jgi:hypothetical protein